MEIKPSREIVKAKSVVCRKIFQIFMEIILQIYDTVS